VGQALQHSLLGAWWVFLRGPERTSRSTRQEKITTF